MRLNNPKNSASKWGIYALLSARLIHRADETNKIIFYDAILNLCLLG